MRAFFLGGPTARPAAEAAAWLTGVLAVAIPAAVARYRHARAGAPPGLTTTSRARSRAGLEWVRAPTDR